MKIVLLFLLTLSIASTTHGMLLIPQRLTEQSFVTTAVHKLLIGNTYCYTPEQAIKNQCESCFVTWVDWLIHGPQKNLLNTTNQDGYTPLHLAIMKGLDTYVSHLLLQGACILAPVGQEQHYHKGYTPLQLAIVYGKKECIKVLLQDLHFHNVDLRGTWDFAKNYGIEVQKIYEQADQEIGRKRLTPVMGVVVNKE